MSSVLDASALLAYLQGERGADRVAAAIAQGCCISAASVAEVLSKRADAGDDPRDLIDRLVAAGLLGNGSAVEVAVLDLDAAVEVAALRTSTRTRGLSLGDRACLALAKARNGQAMTADSVWADLPIEVEVALIRERQEPPEAGS